MTVVECKTGHMVIAYVPTPLRSMSEICKALGVGPRTVKAWVEKGAPIAVEGVGAKVRYSAELARLLVWREGKYYLPVSY